MGEPAGLTDIPGEVQVVVAGGGPVGLACAVELGRRGIGCLVVEPRTTVSRARSLYDELGAGFTLLVRRPGAGGGLIEKAARARGVPLRVVEMPGPNGAALTLVRPDQYVAWAGDREPADSLALIDRLRGAASS